VKAIGYIMLVIVAILMAACGVTGGVKDVPAVVPPWVLKTPRERGRICAVGMSEPTFYSDDARIYAAESARKELARTLNMSIRSIMVDISTEHGSGVDEATVTSVSSWTAEVVLRESTIRKYWVDREGAATKDMRNVTYALACLPIASIKQGLPGGKEIGRRIVDELER